MESSDSFMTQFDSSPSRQFARSPNSVVIRRYPVCTQSWCVCCWVQWYSWLVLSNLPRGQRPPTTDLLYSSQAPLCSYSVSLSFVTLICIFLRFYLLTFSLGFFLESKKKFLIPYNNKPPNNRAETRQYIFSK